MNITCLYVNTGFDQNLRRYTDYNTVTMILPQILDISKKGPGTCYNPNMLQTLLTPLIGFLCFISIDYIWLSKIAKSFYISKLTTHITLTNGNMNIYSPAVPLVYIAIILGISIFVLTKTTTPPQTFLYGALFGFIIYAVYDLTNLATLKDYSWSLTLVDSLWGAFVVGVVATIMFLVQGLLS